MATADFIAQLHASCEETNYHMRVIRCGGWDLKTPRKLE